MVRRLDARRWTALLLVAIAAGAVLWHVLACVESPMSFAPSGDLAFTTMEPYGGEASDVTLRGTHVYRLMVLPAGADQPKTLEESADWMISAPAFSPDGQRIAYLRIPLLSRDDLARVGAAFEQVWKATSQPATMPAGSEWPAVSQAAAPASEAQTQATVPAPSVQGGIATLPPMEGTLEFYTRIPSAPTITAQLVERRAADGQVLTATDVPIPLIVGGEKFEEEAARCLMMAYVLSRPQHSPDGQWVYLCPGNFEPGSVVWAVHAATKTKRLVAAPALVAALSPGGKVLAVLQNGCVGFARTDGSLTSYVRWEKGTLPAALVWVDESTLAMLGAERAQGKEALVVFFLKIDGAVARTVKLPQAPSSESGNTGQLAIAPDGKRIIVAFDKGVFFMDGDGKLLGEWKHQEDTLAQPTFTRDGKQVAFKYMKKGEGDKGWAEAIVFFSPDGKELRRVAIPPAKLPETQPATAPAGTDIKPPALRGDVSR